MGGGFHIKPLNSHKTIPLYPKHIMYIQSIPMISFLVCRHADGKAFVESPWAIFLRSDLGSAQSILTSLFSLTIIIVRLREIIPSHGRKIQVSEILEFTQIDGYCNKFLWWLVG